MTDSEDFCKSHNFVALDPSCILCVEIDTAVPRCTACKDELCDHELHVKICGSCHSSWGPA